MNRSRQPKRRQRLNVTPPSRGIPFALRRLPLASAVSAVLAGGAPLAYAATASDTAPTDTLEEVTVTAQKVTENLQNVPISIETLSTQKLEQLNISNIDDYVTYLPGVTTVKGLGQGGNAVGTTHMYMRGVVSGQDGNHSASQPSVGTYFDEQPVTTIDGTVDIHVYDIARIEVLEGPQGTLYGASSEAGTIRIITNKPDPAKFSAGYDLSGDAIYNGGQGLGSRRLRQYPARAEHGGAHRRLGRTHARLHQQRGGNRARRRHHQRPADLPDLERGDRPDVERHPQRRLQHLGDARRPGGLEVGPRRLDRDADVHGAIAGCERLLRLRSRDRPARGRSFRSRELAGFVLPDRRSRSRAR